MAEYDRSIASVICERLAEGNTSLREICRAEGMPAPSTFLLWASEDKALAEQYARAREAGNQAEFEGLYALADEKPPLDEKGKVDPAWVTWQKNRIDTRKWALSKKDAKRYGDKVTQEHTGADGGPVQIEKIERVVIRPANRDS